LERDDVSQMLVLPVRPANLPAEGILNCTIMKRTEVTNEFRARQCAALPGNAGNTCDKAVRFP